MVSWAARITGLVLLFLSLPSIAQVKDIDASRLPQTPAVQAAYRSAQELEPYARTWTPKWDYDIPQTQVKDKLTEDLGILSTALQSDPSNHELRLLTGLVAHFAYNVNDEAAFDIAKDNLGKAAAADPADIRGPWFLAIHQCQSLEVIDGMNRFLALEEKFSNPPADFWDDYITCAGVSILPAHTLRAIDRAVAAGQSPDRFTHLAEIANSRFKTANLMLTIPRQDVWAVAKVPDGKVLVTSYLCGMSFLLDGAWETAVYDVSNGVCITKFGPAAKAGAAPTFMLLAKRPAPGQSLEDFAKSFLKRPSAQVSVLKDFACPVAGCLAFDVVIPDMYPQQGGGHIILAVFERDPPALDGLLLEKPQGPQMAKGPEGSAAFSIAPRFRRIPGKLYYVAILDSNRQIFAASKPQFDEFLKTLVVE